jgi:hypothetical protein
MTRTLLLAALLAPATASAARHEISFEYQHTPQVTDDSRGLYSAWNLHRYGIRGGYAVLRDVRRFGLVVQAGWRRGVRFGGASTGGVDARLSLATDVVSVGVKADVDVANIWYPYLATRAELLVATSRLDGNADTTENASQFGETGVAPAGSFLAGFEVMLPDRKLGWPVTASIYVEGGYQVVAPVGFATLGQLQLSGGSIGTGVGIRF